MHQALLLPVDLDIAEATGIVVGLLEKALAQVIEATQGGVSPCIILYVSSGTMAPAVMERGATCGTCVGPVLR